MTTLSYSRLDLLPHPAKDTMPQTAPQGAYAPILQAEVEIARLKQQLSSSMARHSRLVESVHALDLKLRRRFMELHHAAIADGDSQSHDGAIIEDVWADVHSLLTD